MSDTTMGCEICNVVASGQPGHIERLGYWDVNLSLEQGYLGRGFIALIRHATSLSDVTTNEWAELQEIIRRYESAARIAFGAELFNWVCLMNDACKADDPKPHVHWHVRPRYRHTTIINGHEYIDPNFGHHYDSKHRFLPDSQTRNLIAGKIKEHF